MVEIKRALDTIISTGNRKIILLHCVSSYPVLLEDLNLRTIFTMRKKFKLLVGFSDHSVDVSISPIVATALGVCVLEKHFTIDRNLSGYDHHMSTVPIDFKKM